MSSISSHTAFSLRLRRLEALLSGSPAGIVVDDPDSKLDDRSDGNPRGVQRRVMELQDNLEALPASKGQEALRRFVTHYDDFTSVLFPKYHPSTTEPDTPSTTTESDLLPLLSKLAIVLQAEEDVTAVQKALSEIEVLEKRDASGAGDLAKHETLKPSLDDLLSRYASVATSQHRKEALTRELLARHDDYITTTSEIFVDLNARVTTMEDTVAKLEKRKRDEQAESY